MGFFYLSKGTMQDEGKKKKKNPAVSWFLKCYKQTKIPTDRKSPIVEIVIQILITYLNIMQRF